MALEDLDQLAALSTAVRTYSERNNPHGGGGGTGSAHHHGPGVSPHSTSPRPVSGVTPWSGATRAGDLASAAGRTTSPARAPERLVEVLASIPDQPAITIPATRMLLRPIDMCVQPHGPTGPPSTTVGGRSLQHVIHDGMPKRVGSSHQALAAKHRQIIQSRNERD
jgi:hypothetical protein